MLETWLSKERLLSNSTPRFLTDDEESREQPSSVRQCSKLLLVGVLGPIIKFSSKKLLVVYLFISTMHSISFSIGVFHRLMHNSTGYSLVLTWDLVV